VRQLSTQRRGSDPGPMHYAGQRLPHRRRFYFSDLSAMRVVYQYAIKLKARFQTITPKLPRLAPTAQVYIHTVPKASTIDRLESFFK
jgi:hypothetical protein